MMANTTPCVMAATGSELLGGKYNKTPGVKMANKIAITINIRRFIFIYIMWIKNRQKLMLPKERNLVQNAKNDMCMVSNNVVVSGSNTLYEPPK